MKFDLNKYYWLSRGKTRLEVLFRFILNYNIPLSAVDISRKIGTDISQSSFILRKLEERGLIKWVNQENKRNKFSIITDDGKEIIKLVLDQTFEDSLEKIFQDMKYRVEREPRELGFIADMILYKNDKKTLVEVKISRLTEKTIDQVHDMKKRVSAADAIIVTVWAVDKKIKELAERKNIEIWDGKKLDKFKRILT